MPPKPRDSPESLKNDIVEPLEFTVQEYMKKYNLEEHPHSEFCKRWPGSPLRGLDAFDELITRVKEHKGNDKLLCPLCYASESFLFAMDNDHEIGGFECNEARKEIKPYFERKVKLGKWFF